MLEDVSITAMAQVEDVSISCISTSFEVDRTALLMEQNGPKSTNLIFHVVV